MKKSKSDQRKQELKEIAAIRDDRIDLSDIPELTAEQLRRGVRGQMYRPTKKNIREIPSALIHVRDSTSLLLDSDFSLLTS